MVKAMRAAIVTAIALITFALIGAKLEWDWRTWECACAHEECEECRYDYEFEWRMYAHEAYEEYTIMFNELYASYETKRASNDAVMIRSIHGGSWKFARKG
jgi:hypothetical protein